LALDVSSRAGGGSVDIVFLVDVTGSMSNVIDPVGGSLLSFVGNKAGLLDIALHDILKGSCRWRDASDYRVFSATAPPAGWARTERVSRRVIPMR